MKIAHYNDMMSWLKRKPSPYTKEEKKEIVKDFHKKTAEPKAKPMGIVKYIDKMNRLYGNGDDPREIDPREIEDIKKSLPVSEMVKKEERFNDKILKRDKYETPKKKIIKETLIAEKPRSVIELLEFYDKLNLLDPIWWETVEEEEDEKVLLPVPKSKAKGITAILNLHKKLT